MPKICIVYLICAHNWMKMRVCKRMNIVESRRSKRTEKQKLKTSPLLTHDYVSMCSDLYLLLFGHSTESARFNNVKFLNQISFHFFFFRHKQAFRNRFGDLSLFFFFCFLVSHRRIRMPDPTLNFAYVNIRRQSHELIFFYTRNRIETGSTITSSHRSYRLTKMSTNT